MLRQADCKSQFMDKFAAFFKNASGWFTSNFDGQFYVHVAPERWVEVAISPAFACWRCLGSVLVKQVWKDVDDSCIRELVPVDWVHGKKKIGLVVVALKHVINLNTLAVSECRTSSQHWLLQLQQFRTAHSTLIFMSKALSEKYSRVGRGRNQTEAFFTHSGNSLSLPSEIVRGRYWRLNLSKSIQ